MPTIKEMIRNAFENLNKVQKENDFFKARDLLNNARTEMRKVKDDISKGNYSTSEENFHKEDAEALIEHFENQLPSAIEYVKNLTPPELREPIKTIEYY